MQFSIRWLLAFVACAALLCMMLLALPDSAAFWSLLLTTMAVPSLSIPVIVYGRDDVRAFAIGVISSFGLTPFAFWFLPVAVLSRSPTWIFDGAVPGDEREVHAWKIFFFAALGSSFLLGLASIGVRHLLRRQPPNEVAIRS